jgi:hypothetical protein
VDDRPANFSVARNYELLSRLLAVSGDPAGARSDRQECAAILERAMKAGDGSQATIDSLNRCRAGLQKYGAVRHFEPP